MKKFLTWTFVSLVAVLAMGLITLELFTQSTARERDAAITKVRARATENFPHPSSRAAAADLAVEVLPLADSSDGCDAQAARWEALEKPLRLGTLDQNRELWDIHHKIGDGASAIITNRFDTKDFGEDFLAELEAYVERRKEVIKAVKLLLFEYSPDCEFLQQFPTPEYHFLDHLLLVELGSALHRGDFDTAIEDLTATISLAYMVQGYRFPHRIEPDHARILFDALNSGVVREETWRRFLRAMRAYRDRDFMIHFIRRFPHVPFGASVQESSYWGRGIRAAIQQVQEPALNREAARLAPLLADLEVLGREPYYVAKPGLDRLIAEYDLTPHERHSYSNESAARASIVNLIHVVFPRNAAVQAQIDLFSIALALHLTRIRLGSYPESLDVAADALSAPIPINPFNGSPYHYEISGNGFRLGFELDNPVMLPALDRESTDLWVESVNGELRMATSK